MKGNGIYLVHPPTDSNITCVNNYEIESAIEEAMKTAGVTIYQDSLLAQWNDGEDPDPIHSASFTTSTKPFRLECSVSPSLWTELSGHLGRVLTSQGLGTLKDVNVEFIAIDLGHVFKLFSVVEASPRSKKLLPTWWPKTIITIYCSWLGVCLTLLDSSQEISCIAKLRQ